MPDDVPILIFDEVSFAWQTGAPPLFRGLNWRVPRGAALCLTAPSGKGKSTLLQLAAGLLKAASGTISARWERAGFLFQEPHLLPWLTAAENVAFALGNDRDANTKVRLWLERMAITDCADSRADQLSGGQQNRVNLARALAVEPDMLFLDEPFTGIDGETAGQCAAQVRNWQQARPGRTLIMTSHIPEYAAMCNAELLPLAQIMEREK